MPKRICNVCQTSYNFCPHCDEDRGKPGWMIMFHDQNCHDIFNILQKHYLKTYTTEEAAELLKKCDLSKKEQFVPAIRKDLDAILDAVREKKTTMIETPSESPEEEPQKPIVNRKRKTSR